MDDDAPQPSITPVGRPLHLVPVQLKEAALDSPTFRALALHHGHQVEGIEKWLRDYVKQSTKFCDRFAQIQKEFDNFSSFPMPPPDHVSQAVLDHDYTLTAVKHYSRVGNEYLKWVFANIQRSRNSLIDPLTRFIEGSDSPLRQFNNTRKTLERTQQTYDAELARYLGQGKSKEASSLREDAFKLHEDRKQYLKASMDYCIQAPSFRSQLDSLLITVFSNRWKDFYGYQDATAENWSKWSSDMERIRSWSNVMQSSEHAFKRELLLARRQLEESAETNARPSREMDDYAASTVPFIGSSNPLQSPTRPINTNARPEKQGWLFLKNTPPKPNRPFWSRRWFIIRNGIFGWLVQGAASGGVEESEKVGVLLCSVRPAVQEERRFCFQVKTKDATLICQAETQQELVQWIGAFDSAKRNALDDPRGGVNPTTSGSDPAFAISPPVDPDFAAKVTDGHIIQSNDDNSTLALPADSPATATRSSFDVTASRRSTLQDSEGGRDHAARLIQKLDIHRRGTANSQQAPSGGIASLLSASHSILPIGPSPNSPKTDNRSFTMPVTSTFAPATLANPPAPTNLSRKAVAVSGQRATSAKTESATMPSSLMANLWGSSNWVNINRLGRDDPKSAKQGPLSSKPNVQSLDDMAVDLADAKAKSGSGVSPSRATTHRKTISVGSTFDTVPSRMPITPIEELQTDYPESLGSDDSLVLKEHDAEFHVLFPSVSRSEKVILVFTAMWNPNEQQEFPGRIYVTSNKIYFYSNHFGMVLVAEISLSSITEITAAPGRESECDYLFLHLKETKQSDFRRVTIKTFLDVLRPLQRRLDFLVQNANSEKPAALEEIFSTFAKMAAEPNLQDYNDTSYSPVKESDLEMSKRRPRDLKANLRIDGTLYGDVARTGREVTKFKLPGHPVLYKPKDTGDAILLRDFNISAKALFHVMFGDRSAVFQMLYKNRPINNISQTPWTKSSDGIMSRQFTCSTDSSQETDKQSLDIHNDHLCYVVSQTQSPWHLPMYHNFRLLTKFVITHSEKSQCKLAIFNKVSWVINGVPVEKLSLSQYLVQRRALHEYEADAFDLAAVATDQVSKLGAHSKTNRAMQIFGSIGQTTQMTQVSASDLPNTSITRMRRPVKHRSLLSLYVDEAFTQAFRLLTTFIELTIALAQSITGIVSAHKILVVLLAISAACNTWFSYRDGLAWYGERNAGKFMARLGVKPNPTISRAIYLSDIEDWVTPVPLELIGVNETMAAGAVEEDFNTCHDTFRDMLLSSDLETTTTSRGATRHAEVRLQRTRNSLARYRHDLLVALRVVNRVEEEVVHAEWEEWVLGEERKCRKIEEMFSERKKAGGKVPNEATSEQEDGGVEGLGEDFAGYCRSCKIEAGRIISKK